MTLNEHYKYHSRKSLKSYTRFLILLVFVIVTFQTLARYISGVQGNAVSPIAKWHILINGEQISNNVNSLNQTISLLNSADDTTSIDEDDECYFDIVINPSTTEVSIRYTIFLDLTAQNNTLPDGTLILRYEKYSGSNNQLVSTTTVNDTDVSVSEIIALSNSSTALGSNDIRKYRFFCKLPRYINAQINEQFTVVPQITVIQNIGS